MLTFKYKRVFSVVLFVLPFLLGVKAQNVSDEYILKAAGSCYRAFLDQIPSAQIADFGFNSKAEFNHVTLGKPIRMKTINGNIGTDSPLKTGNNYLVATNEWRVPLVVNGQYRVFLSVAGSDSMHLSCVDFGAAELALEISQTLASKSTSVDYAILRLYSLKCDMLIVESDIVKTDYELIPLQSAAAVAGKTLAKTSTKVSLNMLLPLIKQQVIIDNSQSK